MTIVYGLWTEDQEAWSNPGDRPVVFTTKEEALRVLKKYLRSVGEPQWLGDDNLAYIYEIEVK